MVFTINFIAYGDVSLLCACKELLHASSCVNIEKALTNSNL